MLDIKSQSVIQMPQGLMGFEQYKEYLFIANPSEAPFYWLQVATEPEQALLVVSPFLFQPDYQPEVGPEDARVLGIQEPRDATIACIVTIRSGGKATVNLKGPIIINHQTLVAKQVVPANALQYSLQHPLPVSGGLPDQ
jgi:flagellar assembly factor FliW